MRSSSGWLQRCACALSSANVCSFSRSSSKLPPSKQVTFLIPLCCVYGCLSLYVFRWSCKEYKNLNGFFAITMGLSNAAVCRLNMTWEVSRGGTSGNKSNLKFNRPFSFHRNFPASSGSFTGSLRTWWQVGPACCSLQNVSVLFSEQGAVWWSPIRWTVFHRTRPGTTERTGWRSPNWILPSFLSCLCWLKVGAAYWRTSYCLIRLAAPAVSLFFQIWRSRRRATRHLSTRWSILRRWWGSEFSFFPHGCWLNCRCWLYIFWLSADDSKHCEDTEVL